MELEARRRRGLCERGREAVDDVERGPGAEAGDVRLGEKLDRMGVPLRAYVLHAVDVHDLFRRGRQANDRLGVGCVDRAVLANADDDHRNEVRLPDQGLCEVARDPVLGALAGKNAELSLLTWLARDGRKWTDVAVPMTQTTT